MAYKTISLYTDTTFITKTLQENFGYTIINLRKVLVTEFGYKTTKDIKSKLSITSSALFAPLAFRDQYGYSLLVKAVSDLLGEYQSSTSYINRIDCCSFYYTDLRLFRAVRVYETLVRLLLNNNKLLKYENRDYIP